MRIIYILSVSSLFFFTSCENLFIKDLELEEFDFEKQAVLQSFVSSSTDTLKIFLSENTSVLETDEDVVLLDDAEVEVYLNDAKLGNAVFNQNEKQYLLPFATFPGEGNYRIIAKTTEYGEVSASTNIPPTVEIRDFKLIEDAGIDPLEQTQTSAFQFKIIDPPGRNHYAFKIDFLDPNYVRIDTFIRDGDTIIRETIPDTYTTITDPNVEYGPGSELILSDDTFEGGEYIIYLRFKTYPWASNEVDRFFNDLYLHWRVLSEDYYKYQTSLNDYYNSQFGLFSDPVGVFTNVDNGLGAFYGSNVQFIPIR